MTGPEIGASATVADPSKPGNSPSAAKDRRNTKKKRDHY